jgi:hypothetical protein
MRPIAAASTLLTEMLVSILRSGRVVPVTTISSCCAPVSTVPVGPVIAVAGDVVAEACAHAGFASSAHDARSAVLMVYILFSQVIGYPTPNLSGIFESGLQDNFGNVSNFCYPVIHAGVSLVILETWDES